MNSTYITLVMDRDDPASVEWIEKYNICCLPTFQVLDHKGKQISYSEGSLSTPSFYKFLDLDLPPHVGAGVARTVESDKVDIDAATLSMAATDEIFELDLTDVTAKRSENIVYKKEEYIQAGSSRNIKVDDRLRERLSPQFENVLIIQERDGCDGDDVYNVIIGPVMGRSARHKIMSILELKGITRFSKII